MTDSSKRWRKHWAVLAGAVALVAAIIVGVAIAGSVSRGAHEARWTPTEQSFLQSVRHSNFLGQEDMTDAEAVGLLSMACSKITGQYDYYGLRDYFQTERNMSFDDADRAGWELYSLAAPRC